MSSSIAVVLRARPSMMGKGADGGEGCTPREAPACAFDEDTATVTFFGKNTESTAAMDAADDCKSFTFNAVWNSGKERGTDQEVFYNTHIKQLVEAALLRAPPSATPRRCQGEDDGHGAAVLLWYPSATLLDADLAPKHVAVMAYGQTGSGKTHTMDGSALKETTPGPACQDRTATEVDPNTSDSDTSTCDEVQPSTAACVHEESGVTPRVIDEVFRWHKALFTPQAPKESDTPKEAINDEDIVTTEDLSDKNRNDSESNMLLRQVRIKVSFVEVYKEQLRDLLLPSMPTSSAGAKKKEQKEPSHRRFSSKRVANTGAPPLRIRHAVDSTGRRRATVENLSSFYCQDANEALAYYRDGLTRKQMRSHGMNQRSSRSHCIFTVSLEYDFSSSAGPSSGSVSTVVSADISLVDLAGSEKLKQITSSTPPEGGKKANWKYSGGTNRSSREMLVSESIKINQSLLALGRVITFLSSAKVIKQQQLHVKKYGASGGSRPSMFVPYRESVLTTLLQHVIGGNARTVMIACIHPDAAFREESLSTLYYATRAKGIKNGGGAAQSPQLAALHSLRAEVTRLKTQLDAAMSTIASLKLLQQHGDRCEGARSEQLDSSPARSSGSTVTNKEVQLADALLQACGRLKHVQEANGTLERLCTDLSDRLHGAEGERDSLRNENWRLKERLDALESCVVPSKKATPTTSLSRGRSVSAGTGGKTPRNRSHVNGPSAPKAVTLANLLGGMDDDNAENFADNAKSDEPDVEQPRPKLSQQASTKKVLSATARSQTLGLSMYSMKSPRAPKPPRTAPAVNQRRGSAPATRAATASTTTVDHHATLINDTPKPVHVGLPLAMLLRGVQPTTAQSAPTTPNL